MKTKFPRAQKVAQVDPLGAPEGGRPSPRCDGSQRIPLWPTSGRLRGVRVPHFAILPVAAFGRGASNCGALFPTKRSHLRCEVRDCPIPGHLKIRPFILYTLILSESLYNLYLLGKLTERQGRKVTDLRETMAAGLRHGCSSVCIYCLSLLSENIERGVYVQLHF